METSVDERARALLGREFTAHGVTVVLTEVEAYGGVLDPASHAYTRTPRSEIMYGDPWRLYVYRSMGIHHCANIVTGPTETASAVLLRAGRVTGGLDLARERRPGVADVHLGRGPGNLAKALGITLADLATPVLDDASPIRLGERVETPDRIAAGPRVGVSKAADVPWRFWIDGDPTVSAYRRSPRAPAARQSPA
ncbi:MAG: DNA-3-methyladenine glycosylase [Aeromicrobium sp.]|uniref:DNA-3-methyladenine glycosylase n=1 Tax=Aeromicrobium sp. TaxID=1871063 RepID=UPI0039E432F3